MFLSGALGSAHKLKLINNFLSIGCSLVVTEAILAARTTGVDVRLLHQLASLGGANSGALQQIAPWVLDGQMNFRFAIRNAKKDIDYFAAMSGSEGTVGQAISAILDDTVGAGQGDLFMPQLIDLLSDKLTPFRT
ncbi:MAG TPA: NAD-binding protein [Ramlibacter sp.]